MAYLEFDKDALLDHPTYWGIGPHEMCIPTLGGAGFHFQLKNKTTVPAIIHPPPPPSVSHRDGPFCRSELVVSFSVRPVEAVALRWM